ncbi:MAG: TIGR04552 family protein, partial [Deltaproteobacteria bacterium]|nr:TIGR04552 family protein [Deltaproteobacteria bacterium]
KEIAEPKKFLSLFLLASNPEDPMSKKACVLLKTMNIINHIDGRELLYNCPISLRDVYGLVEDKVERAFSRMLMKGTPLLKYEGGRKSKESLITKLLSKKETIAAQINDRVRYRLVTRTREDIITLLIHLFEEILPFNYLIPQASVNNLFNLRPLLKRSEYLSLMTERKLNKWADTLASLLPHTQEEKEYSGKTYQVIKFVVDVPIRLDRFLSTTTGPFSDALGHIVYALVEFQIVDEETERNNSSGPNSHETYKGRQKGGVLRRLTR